MSCGNNDKEKEEDVLTMFYWQAPVVANPYVAGGDKDLNAAALILEPLANYNDKGELVPRLATHIPTVENGGIPEDRNSITWTIKEGVLWSDGTPLTIEDVVFTTTLTCSLTVCKSVASVEGSPRSVRIDFHGPVAFPYTVLVSMNSPVLQKAQFEECFTGDAGFGLCGENNLYPVGTGPYRMVSFEVAEGENETTSLLTYEPNEHFHIANKPFSKVIIKGGGNANDTARAVMETGEADYASTLQIDAQTLKTLQGFGKGTVKPAFAGLVEFLILNLTNPDPDLGEQRSDYLDGNNPHPFMTDFAVRKALSLAIDRELIAEQLYGPSGRASCNMIPSPPRLTSPNNDGCLVQQTEEAKKLLDEAGWVPGADGIREKDGVRLEVLYQTATNSVRQETQRLLQGWWREIGIETELKNTDAAIYFGNNPNNQDNVWRFWADVEMFASFPFSGINPRSFLGSWLSTEIPSSKDWLKNNFSRWSNAEYDSLFEEFRQAPLGAERDALVIRMHDLIVQDYVIIPLIHRAAVSAHSNTLKGVKITGWDVENWNIYEWYREK